MEPVFEPIKCKTCEKILNKPVFLPCGHSICQHHIDEAKTAKSEIKCNSCRESHVIPEKGFSLNKDLEALIENKIDSLDLGVEYRHAYGLSSAFANFVERFERIKNQPEMRIHDYISERKNEIDLKREQLKKEIDQKFLSMIEKLDEFEKECMVNVDSVKSRFDENKLDEKLSVWKRKSVQFANDLRSFESRKWKNAKQELNLHIKEIRSEFFDMHESLFLNRYNETKFPNWGISEVFDTICLEVNDVSKVKEKKTKEAHNYQLGFGLKVEFDKEDLTKDEFHINIGLKKIFNTIRKAKVEYEIVILNRFDKNKSVRKCIEQSFEDHFYSYGCKMMKLKDLLNNTDLYNPENDSFTAQIIIKKIEWIKPY